MGSAAEPDWLTAVRATLGDAADDRVGQWTVARWLLARHDQLQERADRMAETVAVLLDPAHRRGGTGPGRYHGRTVCGECGQPWPCAVGLAAEALRQYREAS